MSDVAEIARQVPIPMSPGRVIADKYRVERLLGRGSLGFVVLARHLQLDQPVVLKFMHSWRARQNPEEAAWFIGQARAAARIRSDYVARVSDSGALEDGSPYVVTEYLEGQDLAALLREQRTLPSACAVSYVMQAIEGLAEAHATGIVHRDLKPSNLFLVRQTDGSVRVKLLDFANSRATLAASGSVDAGRPLRGSPLYMAPEQLRGLRNTDQRVDIWALGVMAYQMLAGVAPFAGDTAFEIQARVLYKQPPALSSLRTDVSSVFEAAVMQCLEKDPSRRFQSVGALAHALAPFGEADAQARAHRVERIINGHDRTLSGGTGPAPISPRLQATSVTLDSSNRAIELITETVRTNDTPEDTAEVPLGPVSTPIAPKDDDAVDSIRGAFAKRPSMKLFAAAGGILGAAAVLAIVAPVGSHHAPSDSSNGGASSPIEARPENTPPSFAPAVMSPMPSENAHPSPVPVGEVTTRAPDIEATTRAPVAETTTREPHSAAKPTGDAASNAPVATGRPSTPAVKHKTVAPEPTKDGVAPIGTVGFGGRE